MEVKAPPMKSRDLLRELIDSYWKRVKTARESGKLVAWCSALGPHDLLEAMDFCLVFPENYAATCGARRVSTEFCQRAESFDFSPDICSYARNGLGAALSGEVEKCPVGGLPKPDLLVVISYCTTIVKWYEVLSRFYRVPLIVMEYPFLHDGQDEEDMARWVKHGKEELQEMITFLEGLTRRRFDYDRLQENIALSKRVSELWTEVLGLCRNVPSPMSCFDAFVYLFPVVCTRGRPEAVSYYEQLKADLTERVALKIGAVAKEEYRLYWDNVPVWFRLRELSHKFASHNAALVSAMYLFSWAFEGLDPSRPLESIAKSVVLQPNNRGIQERSDFITKLVEDYSLDGLIMQTSRTCKLLLMGQYDIIEIVGRKTGVPGIVLEGDMCDARFYSESQVNDRIDTFMELLARRKG